jgi:hypothetical protein
MVGSNQAGEKIANLSSDDSSGHRCTNRNLIATTYIAFGDCGITFFSNAPCLHELKPIAPSMFSISSRKNFTVKKGNAR